MVFGPFYKTEFFFGAGTGFHSNDDVRGVTITEEPTDPTQKLSASPFLVRTKGAEIGVRTKALPGLNSSVSLFILNQEFGNHLQRRQRRYITEPAFATLWRRVDQPLSPVILGRYRCRSRSDLHSVSRLRHCVGRGLSVACGLSAGPDRQCGRQLYSQCASYSSVRRHHARRKDRLVQHAALALSGSESAHRGRRVSFTADERFQRPLGLSVRERLARPTRCTQSIRHQSQSDHLRLRVTD